MMDKGLPTGLFKQDTVDENRKFLHSGGPAERFVYIF
jgi:hypothetical protein